MITGHKYHDDLQGQLGTASGGAAYTFQQYRTTGVFMPHLAQGDVITMIFQMSHRKQLGSALDGVHIHFIPTLTKTGTSYIKFDYAYGWFVTNGEVTATLANTGSTADIPILDTEQWKLKIQGIIPELTAPASEGYSSILMVKLTRVAPTGTNYGAGPNDFIAVPYTDAHMKIDRYGSYNEYTD